MFPVERYHKPRPKMQQSVTETNQGCSDLHGDNPNMDGLDSQRPFKRHFGHRFLKSARYNQTDS